LIASPPRHRGTEVIQKGIRFPKPSSSSSFSLSDRRSHHGTAERLKRGKWGGRIPSAACAATAGMAAKECKDRRDEGGCFRVLCDLWRPNLRQENEDLCECITDRRPKERQVARMIVNQTEGAGWRFRYPGCAERVMRRRHLRRWLCAGLPAPP
jgi:hypothetical protein